MSIQKKSRTHQTDILRQKNATIYVLKYVKEVTQIPNMEQLRSTNKTFKVKI